MEKTMHNHFIRRLQFVWGGVLMLMAMLIAACAGPATTGGQPTSSNAATTPSATQAPAQPIATQAPAATPTTASVPFKAGGISFIGPVKSITSSSLVMSAPNGQNYTLAITAQTDRSAYSGGLPAVGASVNMDAAINPDGSYAATILKPGVAGDPDTNVIAYTGITTSAVGADRVIHFTVGTTSYTFTLPSTADLSDFGGNAQAIGNSTSVKVKVQFPAKTVVSVGNASASNG
jgi:hypothetical protein